MGSSQVPEGGRLQVAPVVDEPPPLPPPLDPPPPAPDELSQLYASKTQFEHEPVNGPAAVPRRHPPPDAHQPQFGYSAHRPQLEDDAQESEPVLGPDPTEPPPEPE